MGFEKMKVYQAAVLLDREAQRLIDQITSAGHGKDIDQLLRTLGTLRYNIPEAYGSETPGRKIYHLQVARGASDEARAILRRMVDRGAFPVQAIGRSCAVTSSIAKMLTAWIRSIQDGRDRN